MTCLDPKRTPYSATGSASDAAELRECRSPNRGSLRQLPRTPRPTPHHPPKKSCLKLSANFSSTLVASLASILSGLYGGAHSYSGTLRKSEKD